MNLYSIDITVIATAYIKADSAEEALVHAWNMAETGIELSSRHQPAGEDICIDGRPYSAMLTNSEAVALSPAMTIHGPADPAVEFVEALE